jgi:hypothetical protein
MSNQKEDLSELSVQELQVKLMRQHKGNVDKYGCSVVQVGGDKGGDAVFSFSYSVGLAKKNLPDLFILGSMDLRILSHMVNVIHGYWNQHGLTYGKIGGLVQGGLDVMVLPVTGDNAKKVAERCGMNPFYYEVFPEDNARSSDTAPFAQILWPDDNGVLPTEPEYDTLYYQPVFGSKLN